MKLPLITIGRAEKLQFEKLGIFDVPARIDTGAKTSSLWASGIRETDGVLQYKLFSKSSPFYSGAVIKTTDFSKRIVASSTGHVQERYVVKQSVTLAGRKIRGSFTLSDRSKQAYPVLVGRNILRGKFIVDVRQGSAQLHLEKKRTLQLKQLFLHTQRKVDDKK